MVATFMLILPIKEWLGYSTINVFNRCKIENHQNSFHHSPITSESSSLIISSTGPIIWWSSSYLLESAILTISCTDLSRFSTLYNYQCIYENLVAKQIYLIFNIHSYCILPSFFHAYSELRSAFGRLCIYLESVIYVTYIFFFLFVRL